MASRRSSHHRAGRPEPAGADARATSKWDFCANCTQGLRWAWPLPDFAAMFLEPMSEIVGHVAHTRPRCEKKLTGYCQREGLAVTLPLFRSVKKYRGKTATFEKPLFQACFSCSFCRSIPRRVHQSDYVANLLNVPDQKTFEEQLNDILAALETDLEICLAPQIKEGARVRIKSGPLRGMEGFVERRSGQVMVMLRLDFIRQAAAVKMEAGDLELI